MGKVVGKLYSRTHTELRNGKKIIYTLVLLCTGPGKSDRTMSGVVVKQTDEFSDLQIGMYSNTWTASIFNEYVGSVNMNNLKWKEIVIGQGAG
jgi:hypothetical protein